MCILRVCVLRVYTSAPRQLWNQKAGVNRNACVHFVLLGTCDHGAANGALLKLPRCGGRSKPERLAE